MPVTDGAVTPETYNPALIEQAESVFKQIITRCKVNPAHNPALRSFIRSYDRIESESQFHFALHSFNKPFLSVLDQRNIVSDFESIFSAQEGQKSGIQRTTRPKAGKVRKKRKAKCARNQPINRPQAVNRAQVIHRPQSISQAQIITGFQAEVLSGIQSVSRPQAVKTNNIDTIQRSYVDEDIIPHNDKRVTIIDF